MTRNPTKPGVECNDKHADEQGRECQREVARNAEVVRADRISGNQIVKTQEIAK